MHVFSVERQQKVKQSPIALQNILDGSERRANKILIDQGSNFYNRSMKSWLHYNVIKMYLTHNTQ